MMPEEKMKAARELTEKFVQMGAPVEGGWQGLRSLWLLAGMPEQQDKMLRDAFFAGAHYMFGLLMKDDGPETIGAVANEMKAFFQNFQLTNFKPMGNA